MTPPRVVVAPNAFKGSLTAAKVAAAVAAGVRSVAADADVMCLPVADGGDGTVEAVVAAGFEGVAVGCDGPLGEPVETSYARRADTAVVELADACGLKRASRADPLHASSYGVGEVLAAALDAGVARVVLGIGGSASTDGGAGMLQALGATVVDDAGRPVARGGAALPSVARVELETLHRRLREIDLVVAADVTNPLLGPDGAAAVYGPQKGADDAQVAELEAALDHWAGVVSAALGRDLRDAPGAGAAGGVGFAALALGGRVESGVDLVLELIGFADAVRDADVVITGEGSLDRQTLAGKAPVGVARAAGAVPTVAVAGRCRLSADELEAAALRRVYPLSDLEPDRDRSIANADDLLRQLGAAIARDWL